MISESDALLIKYVSELNVALKHLENILEHESHKNEYNVIQDEKHGKLMNESFDRVYRLECIIREIETMHYRK